jgi:hypothetical protein
VEKARLSLVDIGCHATYTGFFKMCAGGAIMEATLTKKPKILADRVVDRALLGAASAVAGFSGAERTSALLDLPDEVLGRAFKKHLLSSADALGTLEPAESPTGTSRPLVRKVSLPPIEPFTGTDEGLDTTKLGAQALAVRRAMVKKKELLDTSAMTEALGISRQALNKAVTAKRMFSVEVDGTPYYPAFYASSDLDRRELERVTQKLDDMQDWLKLDFLTSSNSALGDLAPLEALKLGLLPAVLELAKAYGSDAR